MGALLAVATTLSIANLKGVVAGGALNENAAQRLR